MQFLVLISSSGMVATFLSNAIDRLVNACVSGFSLWNSAVIE
jgi:hypothetical protein